MSKLLRHPDVVGAVAGLAVMTATLIVLVHKDFHPVYIVAVVVGFVCVLLYLIVRSRIGIGDNLGGGPKGKNSHFWRYALGAMALILLGIIVYTFRTDPNIKPLGYYILMALAVGLLFAATLGTCTRNRFAVIVAVACLVGLTHIWTESLLFPGSLIGIDSWYHSRIVARGIGGIGTAISYIGGGYSLMHLYLKGVMDILGIDYKTASLVFVGSAQIIGSVVLAGLIGRELFGHRVGAAASAVMAIANWSLFFGEWVIPNSIGATMSMAVAYLLLLKERPHWMKHWLLAIMVLTILAVAYTVHILAAVWVIGTVACLSIPSILSIQLRGISWRAGKSTREIVVVLLVIVLTLASLPLWLTYTSAGTSVSYSTDNYSFSPLLGMTHAIGSAPTIDNVEGEQISQNIIGELTLDSIGMLLYIGIAIFGILIVIRRGEPSAGRAWITLGATVLALGFFPPLFGKSLMEHRWWYFAEVLLSIPLAVALVSMTKIFANRNKARVTTVLVVVVVTLIAFTSTIGLPSNMSNRTLSPNLIVRYALTEGEMQGMRLAEHFSPEVVGTDPLYGAFMLLGAGYTGSVDSIEGNIISGNFTDIRSDMLLIRDAVYKEPFGFGGGTIYKLEFDVVEMAKEQGYKEIWHNGEVHCLIRR